MSNRRGPTLAERAAATRAAQGGGVSAGAPGGPAPGPAPRGGADLESSRRHCWVIGPGEAPGPWPGLILEWHRDDAGGWRARVVYLTEIGGAETAVQTWLDSTLLRPA